MSFQQVWEDEIYSQGRHLSQWPYNTVMSFLYHHRPEARQPDTVRVLEVGCGAGNNLWGAARLGYQVTGLDGSATASEAARQRFQADGLAGEFHVGDFATLPFDDASFDLVIDRAALTCVGFTPARQAIAEIQRVLVPTGRFFFNPYSTRSTSFRQGRSRGDGQRDGFASGPFVGVGAITMYREADLRRALADHWEILSLQHELLADLLPTPFIRAEWRIVAKKC